MSKLSQFLGGQQALGGWSRVIFTSRTILFTEPGTVILTLVGAGGSGVTQNNAGTGGNSAPWGRKKIVVAGGDSLDVNIGAGGIKPPLNTNGNAGGVSTVLLNGSTILTAQGGEGGVYAVGTALATAPLPTATVTGADFWVQGIQAGSAQAPLSGAAASGGAAVDVLATGTGRSPNVSGANVFGVGGSIGTNAGGIPMPWIVLADFGLVVTDGSTANATTGVVGRGGVANTIAAGMFAGAGSHSGEVSPAGRGAGGCAGSGAVVIGAKGGDAYAYMTFTPNA